jgi:hypothetical protein
MVRRLSCHIHRDIVKAPSVVRTSPLHVHISLPVVMIRVVIHLILELADRERYTVEDPLLIDCVDDVSYVKSGNEREHALLSSRRHMSSTALPTVYYNFPGDDDCQYCSCTDRVA